MRAIIMTDYKNIKPNLCSYETFYVKRRQPSPAVLSWTKIVAFLFAVVINVYMILC